LTRTELGTKPSLLTLFGYEGCSGDTVLGSLDRDGVFRDGVFSLTELFSPDKHREFLDGGGKKPEGSLSTLNGIFAVSN